eukprot:8492848-Pyramimonas_sp.AAC.1
MYITQVPINHPLSILSKYLRTSSSCIFGSGIHKSQSSVDNLKDTYMDTSSSDRTPSMDNTPSTSRSGGGDQTMRTAPRVHIGCPAGAHQLPCVCAHWLPHLCTPAAPLVHIGCPA